MIDRNHALEQITLGRVSRVAQEPHFPGLVTGRLDQVEDQGGPDGDPVSSARQAASEARDEYIDGGAWSIVALTLLETQLAVGDRSDHGGHDAQSLLEEAMAHAAHAEYLTRLAIDLL